MNVRVCMMIYHYWPGPEGGTERQCRKLTQALVRHGVVCTVLTSRGDPSVPRAENDGGCRIVRLPTFAGWMRPSMAHSASAEKVSSSSRGGRHSWTVSRIAADGVAWLNALVFQMAASIYLWKHARDFDVIHVHTAEWIAGFAVWIGRRARIPVLCKVATIPVLPCISGTVPFRSRWERARMGAVFVALNEAMATGLRNAGVPLDSIHIIPNSTLLPDLSSRREDPQCVLFVGNLTQYAYKAFDVLFEAWTQVNRLRPSARLVFAGGGDRSSWEHWLDVHGCASSVSFEGFVDDTNAYYARAALLVLPSRQEGMSNALLEAQSWGVPAVVSDIPANRSVVDDGVNGLVIPVGEAAELAAAIVRLLDDAPLRFHLGQEARCRMEAGYSIDSVVAKTLSAYQALMH